MHTASNRQTGMLVHYGSSSRQFQEYQQRVIHAVQTMERSCNSKSKRGSHKICAPKTLEFSPSSSKQAAIITRLLANTLDVCNLEEGSRCGDVDAQTLELLPKVNLPEDLAMPGGHGWQFLLFTSLQASVPLRTR